MPPELAVEYWRIHSFTMAHVENQAVLRHMGEQVERAIAQGTTYKDFSVMSGKMFDIWGVTEVSPFHLETVFTTNITSALQAGKFWQLHDPEVADAFPMLEFHVVLDEGCEICGPFDGMRAERNDPVWNTAWPPLHHR